ncbi:MAG TPA: DoxX family protein [Candidatus Angelobacter sp.]|nr:DoxX family protein [Candidatus Angelobacter sp.]
MQSGTQTPVPSRKVIWAGRILSGLAILFLLVDAGFKLIKPLPEPAIKAFAQLGYSTSVAAGLGIVLLVCVAAYAIPRSAVLGAVLLTGYLGGAVASHLRVGDPWFSHILFPVYLGLFIWGGLFLRDEKVRALLPLRKRRGAEAV